MSNTQQTLPIDLAVTMSDGQECVIPGDLIWSVAAASAISWQIAAHVISNALLQSEPLPPMLPGLEPGGVTVKRPYPPRRAA